MVLFLFIMMLLNLGKQEKLVKWNLKLWVSLIVVTAFGFKLISIFDQSIGITKAFLKEITHKSKF